MLISLLATLAVSPPNLVVFLADDHGYRDSPLYGATDVRTPNMVRIAKDGLTFDGAFVASPACAPSRASLLTGLYPVRHGAMANQTAPRADIKKLPAYLKERGYEVVAIGKIGHYGQTADYGFDHFEHMGYADRQAVPAALAWLRARKSTKPLAFFVGTNWPHVPWPVKDPSYDLARINLPPTQVDTPLTRRARARYYTAVTKTDAELGQVYDLSREILGANTLFLTSSDHGSQFPFGKWNLYEAGIHTTMIATWPGVIAPGRRTGAMVSWVDVLPTLVDVAGGKPDPNWDGESFAKVLRGEASKLHDAVFATHSRDGGMNVYPSRATRMDDWKYIRNLDPSLTFTSHVDKAKPPQGQVAYWPSWAASTKPEDVAKVERYHHRPAEELYDLKADPYEMRNLAGDPAQAARLTKMRAELDAWMKREGDKGLASEPKAAGGAGGDGD